MGEPTEALAVALHAASREGSSLVPTQIEAILARAAARRGIARCFVTRLGPKRERRRLDGLLQDFVAVGEAGARRDLIEAWLDQQCEDCFLRILEAFRIAPHNPQAIDALLGVVQADLLPMCRSLAAHNPSFLADGAAHTTDDLAAEALQGFYVHLLGSDRRALAGFRGGSRAEFRGWLTVAFNNHRRSRLRARNADRRGGRRSHVGLDLLTEIGHAVADPGSARIPDAVEARQSLGRVAETLEEIRGEGPKQERDVKLFLRSLQGSSAEELRDEIGRESSLSASGITKAVGRIRDRIRWAVRRGDE